MAKRTGNGESDLSQKRVRFEDAGTPHRSEASSFAKRRLRLQQVFPRRVRMYMLLHERKCNIGYVARGIDVDPRAKPEGQHQPEGNINDIALSVM